MVEPFARLLVYLTLAEIISPVSYFNIPRNKYKVYL